MNSAVTVSPSRVTVTRSPGPVPDVGSPRSAATAVLVPSQSAPAYPSSGLASVRMPRSRTFRSLSLLGCWS